MRHKSSSREDTKSLRTFALYAGIVLLFIVISLAIKGFLVFQKSKFDGVHQLTLALAKDGKLEEIIAFNPSAKSLYLLKIDGGVPIVSLGKSVGVAPDAIIETKGEILPFGNDVAGTMFKATLGYNAVKTDLTIFDTVRLALLSKGMPENNKITREITIGEESSNLDKIIASYFTDEAVTAEGINIHIINAADTPGVGKRLERVLSNMGASVVRVTSAEKAEKKSKIQYYGEETYTLKKLKKTLGFPVSVMDKQGIGDIVVTVGEDFEKISNF